MLADARRAGVAEPVLRRGSSAASVEAVVAFGANAQKAFDALAEQAERALRAASRTRAAATRRRSSRLGTTRSSGCAQTSRPTPTAIATGPNYGSSFQEADYARDPETATFRSVCRTSSATTPTGRTGHPRHNNSVDAAHSGRRPHADLDGAPSERLHDDGFALARSTRSSGPTFALAGRVVTMNDTSTVIDDGVVYVKDSGSIAARPEAQAAPTPAGFEDVKVLDTHGTIYPGLIDLHDHLSYNALQLWDVPEEVHEPRPVGAGRHVPQAGHRADEGAGAHAELRAGDRPLRRGKCLVAGTTTTQGIALSSYCGDPALLPRYRPQRRADRRPEAARRRRRTSPTSTRKTATKFLEAARAAPLPAAASERRHRRRGARALPRAQRPVRRTGLSPNSLAGHPLRRACRQRTSRCLPHGRRGDGLVAAQQPPPLRSRRRTSRPPSRRASRSALGPDWSPSGSKNLLGELKVARLVADARQRYALRLRPALAGDAERGEDPPLGQELGTLEERKARRPARRLREDRRRPRPSLHARANTTSSSS